MTSRRSFLTAGFKSSALLALAGGGAGYATLDMGPDGVSGDIRLEHVKIASPTLPEPFNGYRIGFLTDLHLGIWVPDEWITRSLEILRAQKVDLLVLGGDYLCINESRVWERVGLVRNPRFAGLSFRTAVRSIFESVVDLIEPHSFPDGIVAIPGNHEYWNSSRVFFDTFRRSSAIRLLVNEETRVSRSNTHLTFFGADDYLTGMPRLPSYSSIESGAPPFRVLLSHNPDLVGYGLTRFGSSFAFDLSLCGHTHGGQVRIPWVGAVSYQVQYRNLGCGLANVEGKYVYTSRGLGLVGVPFRVACPPEVTVIELQRV